MDECTSLPHTLLTLLPPQSLCDSTSHKVYWTWLGLMPPARWAGLLSWPCFAHPFLDRGLCLWWTIHTLCHTHWMCCNSVMIPSVHMSTILHLVTWHLFICPSWRGILLWCSPEGFFPLFVLEFFHLYIYISGMKTGQGWKRWGG